MQVTDHSPGDISQGISDGVEREVLMEEGSCRTSVDTPVPNNELPYAEGQKAGRRQKQTTTSGAGHLVSNAIPN